MNDSYQPACNYAMATAIPMPGQQPSPLEQKICDAASSTIQRSKYYAGIAVEAIGYYKTSITNYVLGGVAILFSKRGRDKRKQERTTELAQKRAGRERRMKNPGGESKYAKKHEGQI